MAEQTTIGHGINGLIRMSKLCGRLDKYKPVFEQIIHQPDSRVGAYLVTLTSDPGFGDYASVVLSWRGQQGAEVPIKQAYVQGRPSVAP